MDYHLPAALAMAAAVRPHTIMDACGPYSGAMLGVHCRPRHLDGGPPDRVPVRVGPVKSAAPLQH